MSLDLGTTTHAIAALFLFLLIAAQLRVWSQGTSSFVLLGATCVTFVWVVLLILQQDIPVAVFYVIPIVEVVKNLSWFALLLSILGIRKLFFARFRDNRDYRELLGVTIICLGVPIALLCYIVYRLTATDTLLFFPQFGGRPVQVGFLMVAIVGLALLEQVIRNTRYHHVWHLKFLCISLGVLFAYDVFLYSNAILFNRVQYTFWEARGGVTALMVPLIAISVLRTRQLPIQLNISRRLVFHTGVLMAAGIYLLLMASVGFYIRNVPGEWGVAFQIMFWVISLTMLLLLMFSGKLRSVVKGYINRHLFSSKFDYREEWLRISNTLSRVSPDETLPERAILALADIVESPGGALWLTSNDYHYDQVAHVEMEWFQDSSLTRRDYLIEYLSGINQMAVYNDPELGPDPKQLPEWLKQTRKVWLIVPLLLHERLLGFVLLKEPRVEFDLTWEDFDLMKAAGQQAASYLAQMVASDALSEVRQFSAFNQVSAFVVHDIKTLNSQLSLLVRNAEKHKTNPSFIEDMIKTTQHAVSKMDVLLKHFRNEANSVASGSDQPLDLVSLVRSVVAAQSDRKPVPQFSGGPQRITILANGAELASSIGHLIRNAQDASAEDSLVEVKVDVSGESARVIVRDSGSGMTQEFINTRLFKPFDSTKGLTGMGIGVFQCRATVRRLDGDLTVVSQPGEGTTFTISLPLYQED